MRSRRESVGGDVGMEEGGVVGFEKDLVGHLVKVSPSNARNNVSGGLERRGARRFDGSEEVVGKKGRVSGDVKNSIRNAEFFVSKIECVSDHEFDRFAYSVGVDLFEERIASVEHLVDVVGLLCVVANFVVNNSAV